MSFFTSLSILILVSLIQASLQLSSGVFLIFRHYASGKYSHKKVDSFTLLFLLGIETFTTVMFLSIYSFYFSIFYHFPNAELHFFPWVMAGICIALSITSFLYYYHRKSRGTDLFIRRKHAKSLVYRAKNVKTKSDAFMLGCFSSIAELIFILPLFILAVVSINEFDVLPRSPFAFLFIISSIIPLIPIIVLYNTGHNIAEIERRRIKDKPFFRFIIPLGYALLAFALLNMGIFK